VAHVAELVLHRELPVAVDLPAVGCAQQLHSAFEAVEHAVEIELHVAEEVFEGLYFGVHAAEDEAVVALDPGHRLEAQLRLVGAIADLALLGHGDELALVGEGPVVIGADEAAGVAAVVAADCKAAVAAAVDVDVDGVVLAPGHDDRRFTDVAGDEVVRLGDLGVVGEEDPAATEDVLLLQRVERGVAEDAGTHSRHRGRAIRPAGLRRHPAGGYRPGGRDPGARHLPPLQEQAGPLRGGGGPAHGGGGGYHPSRAHP